MREYDEQRELTYYVISYFFGLLTPREQTGFLALQAEEKAADTESGMPGMVAFYAPKDPTLAAEILDGPEFRWRAVERVLRERADEVFVNRCAECERVLRTPKAQQCLWCGHDWH